MQRYDQTARIMLTQIKRPFEFTGIVALSRWRSVWPTNDSHIAGPNRAAAAPAVTFILRSGLPASLSGSAFRTSAGVAVSSGSRGKGNEGFDAGRKQYVDLIEAGIIDPTKIVGVALENAVSVAGILLLTEATMTEIPAEIPRPEPEMAM